MIAFEACGATRASNHDFRILNGAREFGTRLVNTEREVPPQSGPPPVDVDGKHHWRMGMPLGLATVEGAEAI